MDWELTPFRKKLNSELTTLENGSIWATTFESAIRMRLREPLPSASDPAELRGG